MVANTDGIMIGMNGDGFWEVTGDFWYINVKSISVILVNLMSIASHSYLSKSVELVEQRVNRCGGSKDSDSFVLCCAASLERLMYYQRLHYHRASSIVYSNIKTSLKGSDDCFQDLWTMLKKERNPRIRISRGDKSSTWSPVCGRQLCSSLSSTIAINLLTSWFVTSSRFELTQILVKVVKSTAIL
jgi:hypothetical protein